MENRMREWLASKMDGAADALRSLADTADGWAESLSPTEDEIMIPVLPKKTRLEREIEEFGEEEARLRFRRRIEAAHRAARAESKVAREEREAACAVVRRYATRPHRYEFDTAGPLLATAATVSAAALSTAAPAGLSGGISDDG